jgi:hypothetical protein
MDPFGSLTDERALRFWSSLACQERRLLHHPENILSTDAATRHLWKRDNRTTSTVATTYPRNTKISMVRILTCLLLSILGTGAALAGPSFDFSGNYGGVIEPASPSDPAANSGLVQVQITKSNFASGVLIWQGQRYPFKGTITGGVPFVRVFQKKLADPPTELEMGLNLSSQFITGTLGEKVSGTIQTQVSMFLNGAPADPLLVDKLEPGLRISFLDAPDPTNEGENALALENDVAELGPAVAEVPGDGFVHVRIARSKKRASRLIGRLPDALGVFTAGSPLRGSAYAVYSSLYKKSRLQGGQLFGEAGVTESGGDSVDLTSNLRWGKDADPDATYYPNSFNYSLMLDALPYPKTRRGALPPLLPRSTMLLAHEPFGIGEPTRAIDARILFRRGNITIADGLGGFDRFFRQNIKITPFHTRVVGENPHNVKIKMDAFSGRFHGSFMHPVLNAKTKFRGAFQAAVLLTPGQGRGHFRPPTGPGIAPLAEPLESGGVRVNVN